MVLMPTIPLLYSVFSKSWGKPACIRESICQGSEKPKLKLKKENSKNEDL